MRLSVYSGSGSPYVLRYASAASETYFFCCFSHSLNLPLLLNVNDLTINLKNVSYLVFDYSRTSFKLTDKNLAPPFCSRPILEHYVNAQYILHFLCSNFFFFEGIRLPIDRFHFVIFYFFFVWYFCCPFSVRILIANADFAHFQTVQVNLINLSVFLFLVFFQCSTIDWLRSARVDR